MLDHGADIEEPNDEGYTPLMESCREGHLVGSLLKFLLTMIMRKSTTVDMRLWVLEYGFASFTFR